MLGCVVAGILAVFLFLGLGPTAQHGGVLVSPGSTAPDFTLPSLTGGPPVTFSALGRDRHRPVVLNFFASWCTPCQAETPLLAATARAGQAKGSPVQFVGVDVAEPPAAALAFARRSGITYPIGVDAHLDVSAARYGLNGQPNTFFVDASGKVLGSHYGAVSEPLLEGWLHRLAGASG